MTDFWESEYRRSFKWPKSFGADFKKDAENQAELSVANESIQTADQSIENEEIEKINLNSDSKRISDQQQPQVKIAFEQTKESKEKASSLVKKIKKPPEMLSYGWANNHPTVPENFMKTFNVTVPSKEVFPSTVERLQRKSNEKLKKKSVELIPQPETTIKTAFKQYMDAKNRLEKLQTTYKSEYQLEYLNWTEPVKEIVNPKKGAAGLPSDYFDKERRNREIPERRNSIKVIREVGSENPNVDISSDKSLSPIKQDQSLSPIKVESPKKSPIKTVIDSSTSPQSDLIESKLDNLNQTKISSSPFLNARRVFELLKDSETPVHVLEKIPYAGVNAGQSKANHEKRHYPEKKVEIQMHEQSTLPRDEKSKKDTIEKQDIQDGKILMYNIDPPTTWRLAQDLLDRAHRNLDKNS